MNADEYRRSKAKGQFFILLWLLGMIVAGNALWGHLMYDDWKCGFIQCRVVVEAAP